jgi:hypothetical protein
VTDPLAEHHARYGEEGAGPSRLVLHDAAGIAEPSHLRNMLQFAVAQPAAWDLLRLGARRRVSRAYGR